MPAGLVVAAVGERELAARVQRAAVVRGLALVVLGGRLVRARELAEEAPSPSRSSKL